ncbi:MAG: BatD family protein [Fuerstiella sp.]
MFRAKLLLILLMLSARAVAQEPELIVEVDRQEIYQGESLIYDLTLNHVSDPQPPSLEALTDFQVESLGQQSQNSRQITIINGRQSEVIRSGMLYRFRLTPLKSGRQVIPAPAVMVNGTELTGREVPINVIAPEQQDIVILEMTTDRKSVYPMQPFTVTLVVAVRELPDELSSRSPLSVQSREPVRLSVPWLDDEQLPDGLKPESSWREILEPLVSSSRRNVDGMQINNIGTQSVFSMFGRSNATVFLPPSTRAERETSGGETSAYVEYRLQRTFVPERVGEYSLAAARMKGTFGTEMTDDRLQGRDIYAVSDSLKIEVRDAPLAGRPESFIGGIGRFAANVDIAPHEASVGDPMTLTLTIHGQGTVSDLRPPVLEQVPEIADHFRTYEATEQTVGNGRVFTYSLRPLDAAIDEFPSIPVTYFDVEKEEYISLQTATIPLTISPARQLATSDVVAPRQSARASGSLELNDAGLFANHTGLQQLRAVRLTGSAWAGLWCGMIVVYGFVSFGLRRHQRLHSDPAVRRRRQARSRAVESLQMVTTAAGAESAVSADALSRIVAGLIADFTGRPAAGLTSHDVDQVLTTADINQELRIRTVKFMDRCDAARYGAGTGSEDATEMVNDCRRLVNDLSRELSQRC